MAPRRLLFIPELADQPGLVHGFSTVDFGSVGLTNAPDPAAVRDSRHLFARQLSLDPAFLTPIGAVHGANVARVDAPQESVKGVDALITDQPGVALFATFADCYPVVLWDPTHRAAALVHAGWRGTQARVVVAALEAMRSEFGSQPADMSAGIGPGICGRCYEVGEEVASRFDPRFVAAGDGGRFLLDLAAANAGQLEQEGVPKVFRLALCTKDTGFLPSHRRAADGARFGGIVAIK